MTKKYPLGFIGAGHMATAIVSGVVRTGLYTPEKIILSNRSQEKLHKLHEDLGIIAAKDNKEVAETADLLVLAIKPQQFLTVASEIREVLAAKTVVISIMAGLTRQSIQEALGDVEVVRIMPNTPAQIGFGMTAICAGEALAADTLGQIRRIFASAGETIIIQESLMDAVSAISGCGPAYFYQILEAVADGGVMVGIPRDMAYKLAAQTMAGAAQMVLETGLHPAVLKDQVTSPGGTTICAIQAMEQRGVRAALMEAVETAYLKSQQLGEKK